jgi:hypothetical protein
MALPKFDRIFSKSKIVNQIISYDLDTIVQDIISINITYEICETLNLVLLNFYILQSLLAKSSLSLYNRHM